MEDIQKTKLFEELPVPRAVLTLAVPTVITSLVMVIYSLADTYFVGMLDDPIENAAVTLASPLLLAFNAVNNLFGVGASSMMSRALGKKDSDTAARSSAFGFYSALLSGVLFSLLFTLFRTPLLTVLGADSDTAAATGQYLKWTVSAGAVPSILSVVTAYLVRAEGAALHAGIGTMSGCFLNILLDPVCILPWGLDMGAAGAGFATMLSNSAACLYFFILLLVKRKKTAVCIRPSMYRFNRRIVRGVCGVGVPASIQNLLNVTGMTLLNLFTAAYGADAVAAMGIVQKINMVPMQIALGLSQGIMPLVGYTYASGHSDRMKYAVTFTLKIMLGFLFAVTVGYYGGAGALTALFMHNGAVIAYGTRFLRGLCLVLPFVCTDFLAVAVFQACGMGKRALLFAVLRKIVLEIPALCLLNALCGVYGLPYAQLIAEVILSAAAVLSLRGILRKQTSPLS